MFPYYPHGGPVAATPVPPTQPQFKIHFVSGGKTLCGVPSYQLKRNERWVEVRGDDAHLVNCDVCKTKRRP